MNQLKSKNWFFHILIDNFEGNKEIHNYCIKY